MYSSVRMSVNGGQTRVCVAAALCLLAPVVSSWAAWQAGPWNEPRLLACDPVLTALFTPPRPQLGRYEVCTTPEALTAVARPEWRVSTVPPLDAFGPSGPYDRSVLSRLYGGRRVRVARGWTQHRNRFESLTLISPHPDATLTGLLPGTLVIRHVIIR
jgi:hypothetical protein